MSDRLPEIPCGVLVFDDSGEILRVNKMLTTLLGYEEKELIGSSIDTILSMASRIFYNTHFFPLVSLHAKADEIFLTLIRRDRTDIPVLTNTVRHLNNGSYENVTAIIPVFQRKKYEDEILQAKRAAENALKENRELQELTRTLELRTQELEKQNQRILSVNQDIVQFSKIISHDLQEPIRKIKLFSSVLASTVDDHWLERGISALTKIEISAERLRQLTAGLREYVNIDMSESHKTVDLDELFSVALEKVKVDREFADFKVVKEKLPTIEGYPTQLELLFYHILDNAVQFRRPDEPLVITVSHILLEENLYRHTPDRYKFVRHVRIILSDNGIGFDDQYKDYVFDLVKKAHITGKGLGIGLALSKKVIDNHHGTIRIESVYGKGTQVIAVLPVNSGPPAELHSWL
jgi:sigma-B regulation protein RsbU (phosphoserine phosphatase)